MAIPKGFSTRFFLSKEIMKKDKENCINLLIDEGFLGYDYRLNTYVDFKTVLEKYPNRSRYSSRYKNEDFIISCEEGDKYLGYTIDADSNDSKIIIKVTDGFCKIIDTVNFSYIDNVGDLPDAMMKNSDNKEIKWLFKYNYFGKDFIEKFGKEFFINIPCVSQEFISEDIIRIDLCNDIFSPIDKSLMKEVSEYLKKFSIKVSFYNHKDFYID